MFDPKIWFQTSGKFRNIAKFPEGLTGMQALKQSATYHGDIDKWIDGMGEGHSGDHYLRCYAASDQKKLGTQLTAELDKDQWKEFKAAGGTTYMNFYYFIAVRRCTWRLDTPIEQQCAMDSQGIVEFANNGKRESCIHHMQTALLIPGPKVTVVRKAT